MSKPTRSHFVTDKQIREWIVLFRDKQQPVKTIASRFKVHQNTVWYHFGKLGIHRRDTEAARMKALRKFAGTENAD